MNRFILSKNNNNFFIEENIPYHYPTSIERINRALQYSDLYPSDIQYYRTDTFQVSHPDSEVQNVINDFLSAQPKSFYAQNPMVFNYTFDILFDALYNIAYELNRDRYTELCNINESTALDGTVSELLKKVNQSEEKDFPLALQFKEEKKAIYINDFCLHEVCKLSAEFQKSPWNKRTRDKERTKEGIITKCYSQPRIELYRPDEMSALENTYLFEKITGFHLCNSIFTHIYPAITHERFDELLDFIVGELDWILKLPNTFGRIVTISKAIGTFDMYHEFSSDDFNKIINRFNLLAEDNVNNRYLPQQKFIAILQSCYRSHLNNEKSADEALYNDLSEYIKKYMGEYTNADNYVCISEDEARTKKAQKYIFLQGEIIKKIQELHKI